MIFFRTGHGLRRRYEAHAKRLKSPNMLPARLGHAPPGHNSNSSGRIGETEGEDLSEGGCLMKDRARFKGLVKSPVSIKTRGGEVLTVHFEIEAGEVNKVFFEGDVHIIYEGEMWEEAYT